MLLVNTGLDAGYLAAGAWLVPRTRWRGDGAAVLVQGAFLLWLDATSARRLAGTGCRQRRRRSGCAGAGAVAGPSRLRDGSGRCAYEPVGTVVRDGARLALSRVEC